MASEHRLIHQSERLEQVALLQLLQPRELKIGLDGRASPKEAANTPNEGF